jgi:hypothetical protein
MSQGSCRGVRRGPEMSDKRRYYICEALRVGLGITLLGCKAMMQAQAPHHVWSLKMSATAR